MKMTNSAFSFASRFTFLVIFGAVTIACGSSKKSDTGSPSPSTSPVADVGPDAVRAAGDAAPGEAVEVSAGARADAEGEGRIASLNGLYQVEVNWSPGLEAGSLDNSAVVHFHNAAGDHVPAVLKSFKLYMTTMGHGSIKENAMVFTQEDIGHWQVKGVYFSMPGPATSWVVDIEAELDGQTDKVRVIIDADVR